MAAIAHPTSIPTPEEVTAAENTLVEVFFEMLDTMPAEQRAGLLADLRANAAAHGE
jgi:hypothetical protein